MERRDRQPPAAASAATTPRALIVSPYRAPAHAWTHTSRSPLRRAGDAASTCSARDGDRRCRRAPSRRPGHDRRPPRRDRSADAAVVATRSSRGHGRAARAGAGVLLDSVDEPDGARRIERAVVAPRARLRGRPRLAALARPGASGSPPSFDPPRLRPELCDIESDHHPAPSRLDGAAMLLRGLAGLAPALADRPAAGRRRGLDRRARDRRSSVAGAAGSGSRAAGAGARGSRDCERASGTS